MKYMKIFRSPMLVVGLAAPLLFALPGRAQEVSPDHFDIMQAAPVAKAMPAQNPVQLAVARGNKLDAARTHAKLRPESGNFIGNSTASAYRSGDRLTKRRAAASRKASARIARARSAVVPALAINE